MPTRATDADRQETAIGPAIFRNPALEETENIVVHCDDSALVFEKAYDRLVEPGQLPELKVPVRIGQAAQIKKEAFAPRKRTRISSTDSLSRSGAGLASGA